MTRYLVLADIHANLEALEAVLADAPPYDSVIFLGDLVGYGADPNACVARVRELPNVTSLVGNHDWAALGKIDVGAFNDFARRAVEWTDRTLDSDARAYLTELEPKLERDDFALAHGSPREPIWEYLEVESQAPPNFEQFSAPFCLVGHTHVPRVFVEHSNGGPSTVEVISPKPGSALNLDDGRMIINPGGVGQPRDGDPRAAYGILDTDSRTFDFYRVAYPVEVAKGKIEAAGLPTALGSRLRFGL